MKPGIYVEANRLVAEGISLLTTDRVYHAYLVYRDGKGNERVIRGHPEGSEAKKSSAIPFIASFVINIEAKLQVDIPLSKSRDAYNAGDTPESRHSQRLDIGNRSPAEVWKAMVAHARKLENTEFDYDINSSEPSQNSNSVVRSVQKAVGIPLEKGLPKGLPAEKLPGLKRDLSDPDGPARRKREYDGQLRSFRDWEAQRRRALNPKRGAGEESPSGAGTAEPSGDRSHSGVPDSPVRVNGTRGDRATAEDGGVLRKIAASSQTPQEILAKSFRKVTEDEIEQLIGADGYWERGMPLNGKLQDYVRGWMDEAYGTGPLQYDGAGQMIRPQPVYTLATQPISARGPDGVSVESGLKRIGEQLADRHRGKGMPVEDTIAALQTVLNEMPDEGSRLRVDGDLGPATTARLRRAVLNAGATPVIDALAHAWPGKRRRAA